MCKFVKGNIQLQAIRIWKWVYKEWTNEWIYVHMYVWMYYSIKEQLLMNICKRTLFEHSLPTILQYNTYEYNSK